MKSTPNSKTNRLKALNFKHLVMVILLLFGSIGFTQAQEIMEIADYLASPENDLKELLEDNSSTILISSTKKRYPDSPFPQKISIGISAAKRLIESDSKFGSVELIRFAIKSEQELGSIKISASELSQFTNLKVLVFSSSVEMNADDVKQMITGFENSGIIVLYQFSDPN